MMSLTVHQLFEQQVALGPERLALQSSTRALTFEELNCEANKRAQWLKKYHQIHSDKLIPVIFDRTIDMVIAILAVLKAGAAYIPISSSWPIERIQYILDDCDSDLVLTQKHLLKKLPFLSDLTVQKVITLDETFLFNSMSDKNPISPIQSHHLMYAIYTSGSTGNPKGVLIEHASVIHLLKAINEHIQLQPQDNFLALARYTFDISVLEIFLPLINGACCVIAEEDIIRKAHSFSRILSQFQITAIQATPAFWQLLLEQGCRLPPYLKILCGGEALLKDTAELLLQQVPQFWNVYGPTETTIWSTIALIKKGMSLNTIPIGTAIGQTKLWILNERMQCITSNEPGELYISGAGLARGYLNNRDLTMEYFIDGSFMQRPELKLYKTGDIVRPLANGQLEFINRVDNQIKINGYRVELAEIEHQLMQHPLIDKAIVLLNEDNNIKQLQAWIVTAHDTIELDDIHPFLIKKLPDYMIPQSFFLLKELPLTAHGKVDRKSLLKNITRATRITNVSIPPQSKMELSCCEIWSEVLKIDRHLIGKNSHFFQFGGHSLHAVQIIARIFKVHSIKLMVNDLFINPTLEQFAHFIEMQLLHKRKIHKPVIIPELAKRKKNALSFAQERLWFGNQLDPESRLYNIPLLFRIKGPLNIGALDNALTSLIKRHEILRTIFIKDGNELVQYILDTDEVESILDIVFVDYDETNLLSTAQTDLKKPFLLDKGPLIRAKIYASEPTEEYLLLITLHHIICDEWSIQIILREFGIFYQYSTAPQLPILPLHYVDFAVWQRQHLTPKAMSGSLDYWQKQLFELPALNLPIDYPRPLKQVFTGQQFISTVSNSTLNQMKSLSQRYSVSLFTVLLTGFSILCSRFSGQQDFAIGTPVAGRNQTELESLVGLFINNLTLRMDLSDAPATLTLLKRNQTTLLNAMAHQHIPFDKVVEAVNPIRDQTQSPLVQVMLVMQNMDQESLVLSGTEVTRLDIDSGSSQLDLVLTIRENHEGLQCTFVFNDQLFKEGSIKRMSISFLRLLEEMIHFPEKPVTQLKLISADEELDLFQLWNKSLNTSCQGMTLNELFEKQVDLYPDHIALIHDGFELTYRELNRKASQLANYLRHKHQVTRNTFVIIMAKRSFSMIIAVLAVLKAGGVYIPLDSNYPEERIKEIVEDCKAKLILTHGHLISEFWNNLELNYMDLDELNRLPIGPTLKRCNTSHDLAYIIYTSGSTGKPKGVMIRHAGVVNTVTAQIKAFNITSERRILQCASFGFDSSVSEMFRALLSGAALVICDQSKLVPGIILAHTLKTQGVTVLTQTPAALALLPLEAAEGLQTLITAGEACPPVLMQKWASKLPFFNAYGPTESSICTTIALCDSHDNIVPIGRPLPNVKTYVLDANRQPVPVNVWGELYIGGVGVSPGYLNKPELTDQVFITDPFSSEAGAKMYQSGDRVRWLDQGCLEYAGRNDEQIKIRGFRIEPNEISVKIKEFPLVRDAIVLLQHVDNDKKLAAFIVISEERLGFVRELRQFLRERLPHYMIPDRFFII